LASKKVFGIGLLAIVLIGAIGITIFLPKEEEQEYWLEDPTFDSATSPWFYLEGGDLSDVDADLNNSHANFKITGETRTFTVISGTPNSSTSQGWKQFRNGDYVLPDIAEIRSYGCFVYHHWNDLSDQAPSIHWKKNVSIPIDMSDYIITSASIEVIFNASVDQDIDTPLDSVTNFAIGDSVTFYTKISDLGYNPPVYTVARNKTKYLGQYGNGNPSILSITDKPMEPVSELDLITALNSAFGKDPDHSNFTITLGMDIYSEDNEPGSDNDHFNSLIIKSCNLTFTCKKKIDQFTYISWNQEGESISGTDIRIQRAKLFFKYKIDKSWPSTAPLSEMIIYINNKRYTEETIKLSDANIYFEQANPNGFDIYRYLEKDINISLSIQIYLKDSFELNEEIIISIDDIYLYIDIAKIGNDWLPLVIILSSAILGISIFIILYYKIFQFPAKVRKIRKLIKKIRKGKKTKPFIMDKRSNIIKKFNLEKKKILEFEKSEIETGLIQKSIIQINNEKSKRGDK